ncbi:hypothetical protein D0X99_03100 [Algoriphagus lacus]|uniref:Uncharacterized protein n=1 Tax=Algoriphagus lacus TaxID=2056311 RepID=A0A418PX85_9BACT|nr:hypothetical protein [Algoriphagus lacus]RIW18685.1 hypothetical protein D0X99_03100 [Algoriphagus lacus]
MKKSSVLSERKMNIDKDPELSSFFQELKENDQKIPTPEFPEMARQGSITWWIPLGIAASLALGFFLWPSEEPSPDPPAEVIIITLQEDENKEQQILIEEKTYLETWESPTASLLAEY